MISTLTIMLVMQAPSGVSAVRPVLVAPNVATVSLPGRKQRMIADGRALLARAEQLDAGYAPAAGQPSKAELKSSMDQVKSDLDSLSEMGEMESLRLQMAMDRLSKMMSTLSNLLKKASETQDSIIQNIK